MNDDKSIDLKTEYNKATNELVELRQKYSELEQDWKYIKSLLDAEFEKGIELKKENEQLKQQLAEVRKENYGNIDGLAYKEEVEIPYLSERISDLECENEQLKQTIDELNDYTEQNREIEYINDVYKEDGFKGVIEYAKNQLSRYGAVREVDKGLWLLATGGWSDHESWLDCLLSWNFLYARGHYRATTSGGGYYYSETPYAHIEVKLEDDVQH